MSILNIRPVSREVAKVKLTKGYFAIVDKADYASVSKFKWRAFEARNTVYAVRSAPFDGKKRKNIFMHRQIKPGHPQIDHRDRNGLNNRKRNLRPCSRSQNQGNGPKRKGSSNFKGVSHRSDNSWQVYCGLKYIGVYKSETIAAKAYNKAASNKWGKFALLNIIL